jgi:hypothetical protein
MPDPGQGLRLQSSPASRVSRRYRMSRRPDIYYSLTKAMAVNMTDPLEEAILRRIPLEIAVAGAVMGLLALPFFGAMAALFVAAGAVLAALGFLWMKASLTRLLARGRKNALRSGVLVYAARLALILAAFFLIILFFPGRIIAFVAGFSAPVPIFLVEGVFALRRTEKWKS